MIDLSAGAMQFLKGEFMDSEKTEHNEVLSLSLPCEIFCFKPVFGDCSHSVSHAGSLHSHDQTKKKVHLDLIIAFQCLLVCM